MDKLHAFYNFYELAGTFVFAISGAAAAKQKDLDLFGICAIAFIVACGGGIIRDLCIGVTPPVGLTNWHYLVMVILATAVTTGLYSFVQRFNHPVLFFDALGLALFAVTGTQKSLAYGDNAEAAVILGVASAVGGGVLRDILLNRVPIILKKEIYASAALLAALIVVAGDYYDWLSRDMVAIIALSVCFGLRLLALRFKWNARVD